MQAMTATDFMIWDSQGQNRFAMVKKAPISDNQTS